MTRIRKAVVPVVRPRPRMWDLTVFPHEHPQIKRDAHRMEPQRVIEQVMQLECKRERVTDRITRTKSGRRARSLEDGLRGIEYRLNRLLLVRLEQRGVLPRASEPSQIVRTE